MCNDCKISYMINSTHDFYDLILAPVLFSTESIIDLLSDTTELRDRLEFNTRYFREKMTTLGFNIKSGTHPIVPVMLFDAKLSQEMSNRLLQKGVYVIGFFYPVVPKNLARIRVQISASHTVHQLDFALNAFREVGQELKII